MANTRKAITQDDLDALQKLYDALDDFHQNIKGQAQSANSSGDLTIRKQFEKYLALTSNDLARTHDRIRKAGMTIYRRETKELAEKLEKQDTSSEQDNS